jgi:hypothetical protein
MAKQNFMDELDLSTLQGRLAFVLKSAGPTFVANNTSLSIATANRLSNQKGGTTLESAAEIAMVTGFELKWIALGKGPQKIDNALWQETETHLEIEKLESSQEIKIRFAPDLIEDELSTTAANCLVWKIDYKINLDKLEKNTVVLIDKAEKPGSGLFVVELDGEYKVAAIQKNLDGTGKVETDYTRDEETLSRDKLKAVLDHVNIVGKIIYSAGQI